ncbi:hypothetical protein DFH27DRAFT_579289 [Peziza echinospora]|nr:hypothetical protein DFH27DRAFT_579289 [Peziza echinospora]
MGRAGLENKVWGFDVGTSTWGLETASVFTALAGDKPAGYATIATDSAGKAPARSWMFGGRWERFGYNSFGPATQPNTLGPYVWTALGTTKSGGAPTNATTIEETVRRTEAKRDYVQLRLGSGGSGSTSVAAPPDLQDGMQAVYLPPRPSVANGTGLVVVLGGPRAVTGDAHQPFKEAQIFDPASNEWHLQPLTAGDDGFPGPRYEFCTVAAAAPDGNSWSVFVYGGQTTDASNKQTVYDDMFVLAVPGFTWLRVGTAMGAVYQHTCNRVNADDRYMAVYRGIASDAQVSAAECARDQNQAGGLRLFDLSGLEWTKTYTAGRRFEVPSRVVAVVGGGATGGATLRPKAGFSSDKLANLFGFDSANATLPTASPTGTQGTETSGAGIPTNSPSSSTSSNKGAIIGGVIGGILLLLLLLGAALFLLLRRRRRAAASGPPNEMYANEPAASELASHHHHQQQQHRAGELAARHSAREMPAGYFPSELYTPDHHLHAPPPGVAPGYTEHYAMGYVKPEQSAVGGQQQQQHEQNGSGNGNGLNNAHHNINNAYDPNSNSPVGGGAYNY